MENTGILRSLCLLSPNVNAIIVTPYDLSSDLMDYYYKLLQIAGVTRVRERLYFLWPAYAGVLPN